MLLREQWLARFEKLRVTPGSDQNQRGFRHPIEQKPIRLNVAIPMPCPVPAQWVGLAASWEQLLLPNPFQVLLKALSRSVRKDRYRFKPAGLFASVMAAVVSALGIETGNGNPL